MIYAPKENCSPLLVGKFGKLTKHSTQRHHQANEGKSSFAAGLVRALGAKRSLRDKEKLPAETRRDRHSLSNEENQKWIMDYVDRETPVARQSVEDAETAIKQEQEDM